MESVLNYIRAKAWLESHSIQPGATWKCPRQCPSDCPCEMIGQERITRQKAQMKFLRSDGGYRDNDQNRNEDIKNRIRDSI